MRRVYLKEEALKMTSALGDKVRQNEPLSLHTSFRIGGPADLYAVATKIEDLVRFVSLALEQDIPYLIIGRGTNILVADQGIHGLVIENRVQDICFQDATVLYAESGALLRDLARESAQRGLGGLEWAVGIPGSVGGGIVGNAGAYCGYISDVMRKATVLAPDGTVRELSAKEMGLGYRTSRFKGQVVKGEQEVILSAEFMLRPEPAETIAEKMADYTRRREESQPAEPSAGSVFKRTEQYPAGFLIDQAGLKGARIGGAQISPKHANFIVNLGKAKATDVKALIDLAQQQVRERFGVKLELEIELIGEWNG
jgi:UDP-N-acetylmuramate dehydrogenase